MPKRPEDLTVNQGRNELQLLTASISRQVLRTLGEPADLRSVQVRQLWANHYRVNVLTGSDGYSFRIANSFFLVIDNEGNVVKSVPEIAQEY